MVCQGLLVFVQDESEAEILNAVSAVLCTEICVYTIINVFNAYITSR